MLEILKISADFNNADRHGRIRLNTNGSLADIKKAKLDLKEGLQVLVYDDEALATVGQLEYSGEENIWVARIDWDTLK